MSDNIFLKRFFFSNEMKNISISNWYIGSIIFLVYPNRKLATLVLFDLVASGKYKIASVLSCLIIIICLIVSILTYNIFNRGKQNVSRN